MSEPKTFNIPVSNGLLEHCGRMGESIWYFLWCVDRTTKEVDDAESAARNGRVLGGMPCRDSDIASALGREVKTIRRWRAHLTKEGYIETVRTPIGYKICVKKSKKWIKKGLDKNVQSLGEGVDKNGTSHSEVTSPNGKSERTFPGVEFPKREIHIDVTKTLQGQLQEETSSTAGKEKKQPPPSLMSEVQEAAIAIIGDEVGTGPRDPERAKTLESQLGRTLLLKTWEVWLTDDENLYFSEGVYRDYPFKHFFESGQAESLAKRVAPIVEVGFNNPYVIGKLDGFDADMGNLSPDDIAVLESVEDIVDQYADFCNKNGGGTFKDLAQALKGQSSEVAI